MNPNWWTTVEEDLPKDFEDYLITVRESDGSRYVDFGRYYAPSGDWYFNDQTRVTDTGGCVIAWQPIPEPYAFVTDYDLMTIDVLIDFADHTIKPADRFDDIHDAIYYINLRYFTVTDVSLTDEGLALMRIRIYKKDFLRNKNKFGNLCKGMSRYLHKKDNAFYESHKVGARLLTYKVVQNGEQDGC